MHEEGFIYPGNRLPAQHSYLFAAGASCILLSRLFRLVLPRLGLDMLLWALIPHIPLDFKRESSSSTLCSSSVCIFSFVLMKFSGISPTFTHLSLHKAEYPLMLRGNKLHVCNLYFITSTTAVCSSTKFPKRFPCRVIPERCLLGAIWGFLGNFT